MICHTSVSQSLYFAVLEIKFIGVCIFSSAWFVSQLVVILVNFSKLKCNFLLGPVAEEDDDYQVLRRAAKQHWDSMKQYYEAVSNLFHNLSS